MMNSFQRIAAFIGLLIFGTSITNGEVGQVCQARFGYGCPAYEICRDGFCECSTLMVYGTESGPFCINKRTEERCDEDNQCMKNSKCINMHCECDEGYHRFTNSCRKVKVQGLMMSCGNVVGQETEICNVSKKSLCQSKTCVCSYGLVLNSSGDCEPKASYLARNVLSEYRVKPGVYCREERQCLDGLKCKNFTCSCPSGCEYESKRDVCDCGAVNNGLIIFIGIFFGLLIILFWYKVINYTIQKHKYMKTFYAIEDDMDEPQSHSLSPMRADTPANTSPSYVGLHSDNSHLERENNTHHPEFYTNLHPQPQLSYPVNPPMVNPPTTTEHDPPPPYSIDPPPPYSLVATTTNTPSMSSPASNDLPPYGKQTAYNPYYQESSNTETADNEGKLTKQD